MKKILLLTAGLFSMGLMAQNHTTIGTQAQLEALFAEGNYDFGGLPDEGGDLWFAEGWGVNVISADLNGDGNKDVFVSGNVSVGEVTTPSPLNVLYLGDGTGKFTKHDLSNEGVYSFGGVNYIKTKKDEAIIATTGTKLLEGDWWSPYVQIGLKHNLTTTLHKLTFDNSGVPVWTKMTELPDGVAGAGVGIHLQDIDKDGNVDILLSGWIGLPATESEIEEYGPDAQIIYWGAENGSFTRKSNIETGLAPIGNGNSALVDLNGDGYLDVVAVSAKSGKSWNDDAKKGTGTGLTVSINNKNRTFTTTTLQASILGSGFNFTAEGARLQILDINNDGKPDIWVGNNDQTSNEPWIYRSSFFLNNGDGTFAAHNKDAQGATMSPLGTERATPAIGDFNQDGNIDMWYSTWVPSVENDVDELANKCLQLVGILRLGNGSGGFSHTIFLGEQDIAPNSKITGYLQHFCALKGSSYTVNDFNNDGVPDIIAISGEAHNPDFKGITYVKGVATPSPEAVQLPEDNTLTDQGSGVAITELNMEINAYVVNNTLFVVNEKNVQKVNIYSVSGALVKTIECPLGNHSFELDLEKGLYLLQIENYTSKILIQ